MPDYPLMPGVLMCEAAAQLSSYYCKVSRARRRRASSASAGWRTCDSAARSGPATGSCSSARPSRLHRRHSIFEVQGFVGTNMVFHGKVIGVTITTPGREPGDDRPQMTADRIRHRAATIPIQPCPCHDPRCPTRDSMSRAPARPRTCPAIEAARLGELFGNDHPVELEVGSGKGLFLANAASERPGHNFLGIELSRKYARLAAERAVQARAGQRPRSGRATPGCRRSARRPRRQPAGRPRLLSRSLVEEAAQEAQGVHRDAGCRRSSGCSSPAASCTWPPTSRSTSA